MKLDRVTITGADDSVSPESLLQLSRAFPFVEWGILVSTNLRPRSRFPTPRWFGDLQAIAETTGELKLSLHVCGGYIRRLLEGKRTVPPELLHCFARAQLNFHGSPLSNFPFDEISDAISIQFEGKEIIFQGDGVGGEAYLGAYLVDHGNGVLLFDTSHGTGVSPKSWPFPFVMADDANLAYHGYAGGLGPHNLAEQIPLIAEAAGDCRIWIDMETHVRSNGDQQFDLAKVHQCLEIAEPFIHKESAPV